MNHDAEVEQRRRNVRCLELLDASFRALERDLRRASRRLAASAATAAPDTYIVVVGGLVVGAVPHPSYDPDGWAEYLDVNRDGLADAEDARCTAVVAAAPVRDNRCPVVVVASCAHRPHLWRWDGIVAVTVDPYGPVPPEATRCDGQPTRAEQGEGT